MLPVSSRMSGFQSWAEEEFGDADLGDERRTRRAVDLAAAMVGHPGGQVTSVLRTSASREAAFRMLRNPAVDHSELARSSHEATVARLTAGESFIVAVDQTGIAVTDEQSSKGFGRAGSNDKERVRGLQAMTALALRRDGTCLGLSGQSWWRRSDRKSPDWKKDQRPLSHRESFLWHQVIDQTQQRLEEAGQTGVAWYQLDRGGDSHHVLTKAQNEGLCLTVRAAYDRALVDDPRTMKQVVSSSKVLGGVHHYLRPAAAKRAGHRASRPRKLSVRAARVRIRLTDYGPRRTVTAMTLWVVHVREKSPPRRGARLEWFLLTTRPVHSKECALEVARAYCLRWRVEEFHKTWKSGACNLETSQLRSPKTLKCWATLQAAVASRIERFKYVSRTSPDTSALEIASRTEIDAAILLTERCKWKLGDSLTAEQFVRLVADLGGYTGKSSGGPPGSIVIRRGFEQVETSVRTLQALAARKM
jgi:hypothetical protein